jgi:tetratricopeptide (TPR) repeat protein
LGFPFFGKKQTEQPAASTPADPSAPVAGAFVAQPDKARKFFDHAKQMASVGNFEYALMLYAKGMKFDPSPIAQHEAFYKAALGFIQGGGKPAGREQIKELDGPGPIDKLALAEYVWARDILNVDTGFKFLDAAVKASQIELGKWLAPQMMKLLHAQKKQTKSMWLKAKEQFSAVEAWTEANASVEMAIRLDPTDTQLAAELKEFTARQALQAGGYGKTETQSSGGFRANVRDAAKQQALQDAASLSGSEDSVARSLERARQDLADNPMSSDAVQKLGLLLKRLGTPEGEEEAHSVFMTGFERLNEYRFKMLAGEIRVGQLRRKFTAAQKALEAAPDDADAKVRFDTLKQELLALEGAELRERQKAYPTDRSIKAELGRIEFELGNYEDAMAAFQACKDEAKLRIMATHMLGKCFAAEGWHGEAIGEYREAITGLGIGESERELPIKYDLMISLMELARAEKNGNHAREAGEICSAIVRKDISYRDIRARRKEVDALMKELPS